MYLRDLLSEKDGQVALLRTAAVVSVFYLALVRYLRYQYINRLRSKYPDPAIALKDPYVAEEVFDTTVRREFPWLARQAIELAQFKPFAIPAISKILHATGEFAKNTRKRTEDTELLVLELSDVYPHIQSARSADPHLSDDAIAQQRARRDHALKRINEIHSKYNIRNGDFVYILAMFIVEPIKWIDRYEWRRLDPIEKNAIFRMWYDIGVGMHIKDIPDTLEKMFEFQRVYACDQVRYTDTNWKVAHPTLEHLLARFPKLLHPLFYKALPSLLDPLDVAAFALPEEHPLMTHLIHAGLHVRAFFVRHLMLPRFSSPVRTPTNPDAKTSLYKPLFDLYEPVYPNGYCIHELGPDKFKPAQCPIPH